MTPQISVLIPTRGRPGRLFESVQSLHAASRVPGRLEYVIKTDLDDEASSRAVRSLMAKGFPVQHLCGERGQGYLDMPHWANWMSMAARTDWLLLWNDDARMLTTHWDEQVLAYGPQHLWHGCPDVCLLAAFTEGNPFATEFVFVRKKVVQLLGHWAKSPHCDNWLWTVCNMVGSAFRVPVQVRHGHHDQIDTTSAEVLARMNGVPFNSVDLIQRRIQDSQILLDYVELWGKKPS